MKQVEVKILQQSYLLACKDGQEERLSQAVQLVDDAMTRIHNAGKVRARERIAVLAALNLAYELGDLRMNAEAAAADTDTDASAHANSHAGSHSGAAGEGTLDAQTESTLRALVERLDGVLSTEAQTQAAQ